MPVRRNILASTATTVRDQYIKGVKLLKMEVQTGQTLSTYDRYVLWHVRAMSTLTPANNPGGRNAAHMGPVFLPWHRMFLNRLQADLQRVLTDPGFALPYWDWASDSASPMTSGLWNNAVMGPSGTGPDSTVTIGPFRSTEWKVRVGYNSSGDFVTNLNRGLVRTLGVQDSTLPTRAQVKTVLGITTYDSSPWDGSSSVSFRNHLEGWAGPNLHNRVHVFVGGDMMQTFSPNDPLFFLHHCNVDRIWAFWQTLHPNTYAPLTGAASLNGHRFNDTMFPLNNTDPITRPRDVLSLPVGITYDSFSDLT
jgi:tyrosinase